MFRTMLLTAISHASSNRDIKSPSATRLKTQSRQKASFAARLHALLRRARSSKMRFSMPDQTTSSSRPFCGRLLPASGLSMSPPANSWSVSFRLALQKKPSQPKLPALHPRNALFPRIRMPSRMPSQQSARQRLRVSRRASSQRRHGKTF